MHTQAFLALSEERWGVVGVTYRPVSCADRPPGEYYDGGAPTPAPQGNTGGGSGGGGGGGGHDAPQASAPSSGSAPSGGAAAQEAHARVEAKAKEISDRVAAQMAAGGAVEIPMATLGGGGFPGAAAAFDRAHMQARG